MSSIRVLVVDDSAFLRRALPLLLESDPLIQVVGTAANGVEAVQQVKALHPDVVTLDVLMPIMDGLTALKIIMREAPTAVVMISATTGESTLEALEALALGAVEVVMKPSGSASLDIGSNRAELVRVVKSAARATVTPITPGDLTRDKFRSLIQGLTRSQQPNQAASAATLGHADGARRLVAIAASTGGPAALQEILPHLPGDLGAGIVIVQHIAAGFTRPLADRLDKLSAITIVEATDGMPIQPGVALLCPAMVHLTVERSLTGLVARLSDQPFSAPYRPSADVLFRSIAAACAPQTCAVILTGMGDDGALGMRAIHEAGGWTVAQDQQSCVIYGMPRRAVELGGVHVSLGLDHIAQEIVRVTRGVAR